MTLGDRDVIVPQDLPPPIQHTAWIGTNPGRVPEIHYPRQLAGDDDPGRSQ